MNQRLLWISGHGLHGIAVMLLVVLLCCGCGRRVSLSPAEGRVTLNGRPVAGASVLVQPKAGPAARGLTAADGRFWLGTYADRDGVIPGPAAVSISCHQQVPLPAAGSGEPPLGKNVLPGRYANAATSGLQVIIEPGMSPLEFRLTSP
jgi:hypothetical protein